MRSAAAALALLLAGPAWADEAAPDADSSPRDEFRQTAIPESVSARFFCHQNGVEIVAIEGVASFAPAKVQGVMTFSLRTRQGETHLLYLGPAAACRLVVIDG